MTMVAPATSQQSETPQTPDSYEFHMNELDVVDIKRDDASEGSDMVLKGVELSDCPKSTAGEVSEPATRDTPAPPLYRLTFNPKLENVELYRQGCFHPIAIGDSLHDNQFKIVDKLGFGGWSTVWPLSTISIRHILRSRSTSPRKMVIRDLWKLLEFSTTSKKIRTSTVQAVS